MPGQTLGEDLPHQPVLYHEIIHALQPHHGGAYVDGTVGAGGHAWGILHASQPDGLLLGLDLDPQALELARQRLAPFGNRVSLIQASYTTLTEQLSKTGWKGVNGIVLDLGLSSMQLDTIERGFSFAADAPLDMRFNPQNPLNAADLVNKLPEQELANLIYRYGEERRSRQIAKAIVQARPVSTTRQLAAIVLRASGPERRKTHIHPATRTFQALRIEVNQELENLQSVLPQAISTLLPEGRLAIIAFHSLEDRIVKQYFHRESRDCICPPRQPVCTCGHVATIKLITHSPIRPTDQETAQNPRARSAVLRIAEKLPARAAEDSET
ncbi:MAG TPA: 16S rRNA (cytosine(1402)-N(4))-methyltransferase RsmH [Anaerolineales bacterium]|nr:16S rRNA (cytosine(1402)-N(4))-methyltransferase RsmH [Anaerolineales bacterium]